PIRTNEIGSHEGPNAPGCVDVYFGSSLEMVFAKDGGIYGSFGFSRVNLTSRPITQLEPSDFGPRRGRRDESVVPTCTANGVLWMHSGQNVGAAPWGFSDLTTTPPTWTTMKPHNSAMF